MSEYFEGVVVGVTCTIFAVIMVSAMVALYVLHHDYREQDEHEHETVG